MTSPVRAHDLILCLTPFGEPDAGLAAAACGAGALGVLDLGDGDRRSREELNRLERASPGPFGVRVAGRCTLRPADLDQAPDTVVLAPDAPWGVGEVAASYRVLAEVTDPAEAREAVRAGAHGLIARGAESGGRIGGLSTFVLLQLLLADTESGVPVWACGGIGPRAAAAAVAGGAAGVVLDSQLALLAESALPEATRAALRSLDGSETVVLAGHRVLRRRGPGTPPAPVDDPAAVASLLGARDLRRQLLPVGQDGFLAARFAERWGDVRRTVREVRAAITAVVGPVEPADGEPVETAGVEPVEAAGGGSVKAVDVEPVEAVGGGSGRALRPGSAMSRALGTRLPVAQGPMTRVSDQAAFAAAVAGDGALPFLALALADGERTRAMLTEARAVLDGRPWGVGVLGFAPENIRNAQLEAVRELRPTHAIIAGGRPAQAETLERAGIRTFLHVPSPGLLGQFLRAGARRFVFEGSECGGHVGPRASFPLWEAQLAVLEDFLAEADAGAARQLEVFFAGGIHDERSAAMAAALAAPLTARGAAVGVLMGTAYLFTEEAVAHGAILPLFQRQVLTATTTALLETAPGHATRCVPSPFTVGYHDHEARLRASGLPDREVWEALERLNVGRLRIASKGVERSARGELSGVEEQRQLTDGMFMAGEVAVLRSSTTTVAALHHSVTDGAADFLTARAARPTPRPAAEPEPPAPLDVAVVGMACMFPQAPDLATFWANIIAGHDAVTEVPPDRWDPDVHHTAGSTASRWGGFLPRIPFDPLSYGIPPASLGSIEPVQLLSLEAARRALEDAGYGARGRAFDRSRTSVVFGAEAGSDLSNAVTLRAVLPSYYGKVPDGLEDQLPRLTEDSFPGMLANVISGRIANRLDLGGANYTVDAACASSLAALDVACKELVTGSSDIVLCGGADLHNGINDFVLFSSVHALSPTGRSRAFDSSADGIALGEGVACVVLKRLADAERDGDRVYGVIKGVGSASDGRSLGLTAPRPEGQRAALERAYRNAGVSPAEVGLVEAHGTGTVVGDRTELTVLSEVFTEAGAGTGSCALGSVKSQIGHTKCAAGLAGLIKTTLALYTGVKPPTLHLERPGDGWSEEDSPFAFHTRAQPWAAAAAERLAGVSAFGFGGTNFHVVVGAYGDAVAPAQTLDAWPAELFLFRGKDTAAAHRDVERILGAAETDGHPWRLRDLALAAARRADTSHEPVRAAVVARDVAELTGQLRRVLAGEHDPAAGIHLSDPAGPTGDAKVAFLFPGQGSQRPGMLADLLVALPGLRHYLELGRAHADRLYPPAAFDEAAVERRRAALTDTRAAQPALGITGLAAHAFLTSAGVHPDLAAGHSYGELVALGAAGALDPQTLLELSTERASAILAAAGDAPGTMAAVGAPAEDVERALRAARTPATVVVANRNSPEQSVISGPTADVEAAVRLLREAGLAARSIPVACAFHSPVVAAAGDRFAKVLADKAVRAPEFPVWANRTAAPYPLDAEAVRAELAAQIGAPVAFADQIEAMYEAGARIFVEAGPGRVLTRLVGQILGDRPHRTVACEPRADSGLAGWLDALARLAVAGLAVRTAWLFRGRDAVDAIRTPVPRRPGWTVDGHLVRTADGALLPGALAPARRVVEATVTTNPPYGEPVGRDALISEYLRTSREMIAAQRDVLLTYFGAAPGATPPAPAAPAALPQVALPEPGRPAVAAAIPPEPGPLDRPEPSSPEPAASGQDVARAVLEIISERTGYPVDMIEPDLDLEADLSIDSIKRAEIAGELARRLGIAGGAELLDDAELEELTKARTAAAVTDWLTARTGGDGTARGDGREAEERPATPAVPAAPASPAVGEAPERCELRPVPLPHAQTAADPASVLSGLRFVLLGDGSGTAAEVAARLTAHGAEAVTAGHDHLLGEADGTVDGVLHLGALDGSEPPVLPEVFPVLRAALACAPRSLLAVRPADGGEAPRSAGLHGFFRSVAREYPDTLARIVTVPVTAPAAVADVVLAELLTPEPAPVVLRTAAGVRHGFELVPAPLGPLGSTGAGPAGDGAAEAAALGLDRDSVVLLVGGARGITARFATALASASRCRIELLGRTPAPTAPEPAHTAAARTAVELRAALAADGTLKPAELNRAAELILAQREITGTLAELTALGSEARYRSVDFRERDAALQAVKEIHAEQGRLDGVVFAAGVIEDRLIAEKSTESFRRVYGTKTAGAAALLAALEDLPRGPAFTVLFGSIAAVLGNRGQADYAAANDALELLGADWADRTGHRALTVHWGPWAPTGSHNGMVGEELGREYARRGVKLIDPDEGTAALLRELAWGDPSARAVVYTASGW
ncbi:acyl transferase domain-containing protein/NAD(P)H-dependent flavin oxidoreductase YrpB (nitropropane dioxygenase family) [Streptomyces griseochromogenes]|uniref:Acyl transferase domain-containing protein/NAD(P)H-dependent flavin oxidoreductase YrpB (Nitropropane dioxygenase family) n=1 Tax=Streptomyces griseochromogenes TaxID=68214 RepID=A0A1B1B4J4_9ACTN|nr:type I polyketide synthase [Streptomyces griseochromogenes]ANP53720.1 polyketide synthase [Streptomyces griseochromogenes]MBP2054986.1 acyl transferase domain-containing protein/NAD(P)H-dependent flavin oxidoreductase YrpB (nitropropane dioxygenase family) [Streptomyces griseochromogenes]